MPRRIVLSRERERQFRAWWSAGVPVARIAAALDLTCDSVNTIRARLGLPARTPRTRAAPQPPAESDPTPEQIAAACAAIRAKHLAKRAAEPVTRKYRRDGDFSGRVYASEVFEDPG